MLEFAWPLAFAALPLPLLAAWLLPRARASAASALRLPHAGFVLPGTASANSVPRLRRLLAVLAWTSLVAAAARPQWLGEIEDVPRSGRDLLLAVDTSGSMGIQDMQLGNRAADRFSTVQAIATDFIERRHGDRVGLILFGSRAYLLTPLTFDLATVARQLDEATIGLAGRETAIGDALGLAVKRLLDRPENQRVVILLTDGVSNAGELDPRKATELAVASKVRVYTVGIGAESMAVDSLFGTQRYNPSAELDVSMLTEMAERTGGRFYRARDTAELAGIYHDIDRLEPVLGAAEALRPVAEIYTWPLSLALVLTVLAALLPDWRRIRGVAEPAR
ncbi:MAG TPA: VWA domain-containing protein [Dokdonella sp.]|uniref:VWA domain-containing protein n=1 Tax=Dokdonella sp. TaxID=2291710 RepID=UPI0025BBE792|nr:VWA domain-containing protein [Dokdonella sp.]MBX3690724.1 VWA domain-containing protein [Dokdonella sp.]MCW5566867.1 VWA domain-containing protein [Dokdonella sp.]HNR91191.1 VWA domain-containing protein [Dokdonella sp.]